MTWMCQPDECDVLPMYVPTFDITKYYNTMCVRLNRTRGLDWAV